MIITRTPYRISFFGGGTDYPAWYKENGGAVLSTTIDKYCYLTVRHLPPFFEHKHRVAYSLIESVNRPEQINHPSVRECLKYMNIEQGIEIHHDGDLPARSGIGSSSAFTVGLLHALHWLEGKPFGMASSFNKMDLALEAIHVEQDIIKENVGSQDQVAVAVGGFNLIKFNSHNKPKVAPIPLQDDFESYLMLVFTGFPHTTASDIAGSYDFGKKLELSELHQLTNTAYQAITNGKVQEFGRLLNEGWLIKKRLSNRIATPYIDFIYSKALEAGAIGGKLLGAGGGGFMILVAEPDKQDNIKQALEGLLFVPFKFDRKGSQVIFNGNK